MGAWILLLIVAVLVLWRSVSSLRNRIAWLESQLDKSADAVRPLEQRIARLEQTRTESLHAAATRDEGHAAVTIEEPAGPVAAPAPAATVPPAEPPVFVEAPYETEEEIPADIAEELATHTPATAPEAGPLPGPVSPEPVTPIHAERESPVPAPAAAESWEMVVGTSWLNKIGVLVSIIGVALIVSYSFTHIGPAGRVALGYVLSLAMLGAGVWLERREVYRNYAYGLVAGGWAGTYFTTFAMHDVPAAKIIDSDLLGVTLLSAVAAGMIAHSIRYRSQVVTSLAYIVAYATLAMSPLSGFSLIASVPLAVSVLAVSQRFGWSAISTLGIASTYGVFLLRQAVVPGGALGSYDALPYVTLAAYWVTFEAADIIGLRARSAVGAPEPGRQTVPMLALNAVGLFGVSLILLPFDDPLFVSNSLATAGAAYVASAILRRRLTPSLLRGAEAPAAFTSGHGAAAVAAALFAWAIDLRFAGNRESVALLVETELLVVAGLTLRDPWIRRIGIAVAALATAHAWVLGAAGAGGPASTSWPMAGASAVMCLVALVWYANREAIHRRATTDAVERGYSWTATALLATAAIVELAPAHQGLAGLLLAAVLLEAGFRRGPEFAVQSYILNLCAAMATFIAFLAPSIEDELRGWGAAPGPLDVWIALPLAVLLTSVHALRIVQRRDALASEAPLVAAVSASFAAALLAVFEWRVLAPAAVAPMWAATALALVLAGGRRRIAMLRWQGYALVLLAGHRAVMPLTVAPPEGAAAVASIALVIAAMYAAAYAGRRAISADAGIDAVSSPEAAVTGALAVLATISFAIFKWRILPEQLVGPAWAATALALVVLGSLRARPGQRWQGYALAVVAAGRVGPPLLDRAAVPMPDALWAGVVAGVMYAVAHLAHRAATQPAGAGETSVLAGSGSERAASRFILSLATLLLAAVESKLWSDPLIAPVWAATAVGLLAGGMVRRIADLRWQGYVLLFASALRASAPLARPDGATSAEILWLSAVILAIYTASLVLHRALRDQDAAASQDPEALVRTLLSLTATTLLAVLILREMRPSLVTPALGLQGIALLFVGIPAHDRVLRLSGLAVLLVCILKLFLFDLRELEQLARIFSFIVLGLFLLAVSWTYTRYKEQIRRFL